MRTILKTALVAGVMSIMSSGAYAACGFTNINTVKSLSAGFEAWKAVTSAMAECGNVEAELDQEFRKKQPDAFAANPSLYHVGGVANSTAVPLIDAGSIRPLDDLVAKYGQQLKPNQLVRVDGKIMAIAMMVNAQHMMYRNDIFADLGIEEPKTYEDVLAAAEKIKAAGVVDYPLGGTYKSGWNLAEEFVNMYMGYDGAFFNDDLTASINNANGVAALEMMKSLTAYMDPEYLVSDSTYVQQQFQQGKIAMANLWASRAGAMDNAEESQVVGKVTMSTAPTVAGGSTPASTLWWDGVVIASNITDAEAENAFRVVMEGLDTEMVKANNDAAVWLIDGYEPTAAAAGAFATANNGAKPYPASKQMSLMHTALGNGIAAFLTGEKTASAALADIEAEYTTAAKEAGIL